MPDNRGFQGRTQGGFNTVKTVNQYVKIGSFYTENEKKIIKEELFDKKANEIAECMVGITGTQFRRIYDMVKSFEQKLNGTGESWSDNYPFILKVKAMVAYAVARAKEKNKHEAGAYENLKAFIFDGIDLVKDEKDYQVFLSLFEAVYGYSYEKLRN